MKVDAPSRKGDLGQLVTQTRDFDFGASRQIDRIRADLDLGAGSTVSADGLPCEDGLVQNRIRPAGFARGAEVASSGAETDAPAPPGRQLLFEGRKGAAGAGSGASV